MEILQMPLDQPEQETGSQRTVLPHHLQK
uniref:Uncharacterized protein n=1 Tax=Rhizophora mucronata TaxID=61149 RepID=A0A2P2N8A4_RHIMU